MSIGTAIRVLRKNKRISVRDLAKSLGMSNPYLYQVECGSKKLVDPKYYIALSEFFGVDVEVFLFEGGYLSKERVSPIMYGN